MKNIFAHTCIYLLGLLVVSPAHGSSSGPPDAKTGRPGEGTCLDCHSGPVGSADSTTLLGFPGGAYEPESIYTLELSVRFSGQRRWGFELTAVNQAGTRAGQLIVLDSVATQYSNSGPGYLKQTSAGSRPGTPGPSVWTFGWRAPAPGSGPVKFYWCANAADNNGGTSGDVQCRDSLALAEGTGVEENPQPRRFHWYFPNPARNRVVIQYEGSPDLPVAVYSSDGSLVRTLTPSGTDELLRIVWDGRDRHGEPVPEAGYFVRLGDEVRSVVRVQLIR